MMKLERKKSELMHERRNKNLFLILSVVLFAITLMQALAVVMLIRYAHSKHEVHFIPPKISGAFTLSATGVSEVYLRDMSMFLTQLRFNVTATSATNQFNALLDYISPSLYGDIRAQLIREIEQIAHEHLSSAFYPTSFELDAKHLKVKVIGQMKRFVGADLVFDGKETYAISFAYEAGLLKLNNLEKV